MMKFDVNMFNIIQILIYTSLFSICFATDTLEDVGNGGLFKLEGKVINQYTTDDNWIQQARVIVDGGVYIGIIKADGFFAVNGIPSGSYVIEVVHPLFAFDSIRIEINAKGKIRARMLDNVQPFQIKNIVTHPLRLRCKGRFQYFQQREQWRISDFLFNPMVLMMFLPLLMMFLLPKLMNSQDPEIQKEMQQSMSWMTPKSNMPELSEIVTNWLGGGKPAATSGAAKKSIKGKIKQK